MMPSYLKKIAFVALVLMVVTAAAAAWAYGRTLPRGRIAFHSSRDGNRELYVMDADGRNQTRLTDHPAIDGHPSWSPDGEWLAFASNRAGNFDLYLVRADGRALKQLTHSAAHEDRPSWSPDGEWIAFTRVVAGNLDIFLIRPDGREERRLTRDPADDWNPTWLPDGRHLIFRSTREQPEQLFGSQLYELDVATQTIRQITYEWQVYNDPELSPDGRTLVFSTSRFAKITLFELDSGRQQRLTHTRSSPLLRYLWFRTPAQRLLRYTEYRPYAAFGRRSFEYSPSWSADGRYIAFARVTDESMEIFVANRAGTWRRQLTQNNAYDDAPAWWSPN